MNQVKKIAISGIIIAVYIVVMFFTQSFAFGEFQIRVATSLYALAHCRIDRHRTTYTGHSGVFSCEISGAAPGKDSGKLRNE